MSVRRKSQDDTAKIEEADVSFATLLRELGNGDGSVHDPIADPGAAFRLVYDGFVSRGDYERGKPRHAVRQIKQWLGDDQVRSLETKLAGKTRLKHQDAHRLLKLFLSRWNYDKVRNRYTPFSKHDLDELATKLIKELFPQDVDAILLPDRSRSAKHTANSEDKAAAGTSNVLENTRPSGAVIQDCFARSDALVTVSRVRTIIDLDPARAMTGFNSLMSELCAIDRKDERRRVAIWIIDLGLRNDKEAARGAIYNVQYLAAQFQAIALINTPEQLRLFNWLRKNACIIVGSLSHDEIDSIYYRADIILPTKKPDRPWFQSDRLFLESIPNRWLDANGSEAFGVRQGDLWRIPTITAHLRLDNWEDLGHPDELDIRKNLRYFFHGNIESLDADNDPIRCIPLPEPGSRWSDAYRLACSAAFLRLGYASEKRLANVDTPEEALALLRDQHFAALRLDEFLSLPRLLSDLATKH